MKKLIIIISIIIGIILIVYIFLYINGIIWKGLDKKAREKVEIISKHLKEYYSQNGKFPDSIDEFLDKHKIDLNVKSLYWKTKIYIYIYDDFFEIKYDFPPFGPTSVYNSKDDSWYGEE